jgi:hypothetical protein
MGVAMDYKSSDLGKKITLPGGWYGDACRRNGDDIIREYVIDCSKYIWVEWLKGRVHPIRWTDNYQPVVIDCAYNLNGESIYCGDMIGYCFSYHPINIDGGL